MGQNPNDLTGIFNTIKTTVHSCLGSLNKMNCFERSAMELVFNLSFSLIDVVIPPMVKYYQFFGSIALNDL